MLQVGAVLDQQLQGCSHKIMNLSSGHELDSHGSTRLARPSLFADALTLRDTSAARDLVAHFTSVGTPITTGGGELAHTMSVTCARESFCDFHFNTFFSLHQARYLRELGHGRCQVMK